MAKRPNIVFMIADDHRYFDIQALFNDRVHTPNLNRLAEEGTAFTNIHIMGGQYRAVCTPSRAAVLTGGHVFNAVAGTPEAKIDLPHINHTDINPKMTFLPRYLKENGYRTFATGKWHTDKESFRSGFMEGSNLLFCGMCDPYRTPVHEYNPEGHYPEEAAVIGDKHATELFVDAGVKYIEQYDSEQPFFLYMAFTAPHDPRIVPPEYSAMYDPADIPLPKNFMPVHPFDNGEMFVRDETLAKLPRDPYEITRQISEYYAMITHMDAQIGRVLKALEDKGIADNTIVVYTADHGISIGQHGLIGKQNLYDHSIRIPLIIRGPQVPAGKRVDHLTCQMDIFPTLCQLIGLPIPETVDGRGLLPLMTGETDEGYESVFAIYKDVQRMVKSGDWKLIRYYRSRTRHCGSDALQLFNVREDPWEIHNLALDPNYRDKVDELLGKLQEWQTRLNDPLPQD